MTSIPPGVSGLRDERTGRLVAGHGRLVLLPEHSGLLAQREELVRLAAESELLIRDNELLKMQVNVAVAMYGELPEAQRVSFDDWAAEKIRKVSHLGRWQMPEEYAAMACFLASDHAKNITGQTLNIDGGQVMHS